MAALLAALQYIYLTPEWNQRIFMLLSEKLLKGKKKTGRRGMSLWELFVLGQVRLCLNLSYDELHHQANYDGLLRGIMGVLPSDYSLGKHYEYQQIYDNVKLLDDALLGQLNAVIVEVGHQVFKKKEEAALRLKLDSFVVETDIHFPTDYTLLWDSARKCLDVAARLPIAGWRKNSHWRKALKGLMRTVGRSSSGGGKNKQERVERAVGAYLKKARALEKKVTHILVHHQAKTLSEVVHLEQLAYYYTMLNKHIDLVHRRLVQQQTIPHAEKVFSIFQPYTEMIKKGKQRPNIEFGKKLAVTTDQYHLVVDWQVVDNQADSQLTVAIAERIKEHYPIQSFSVDRGFSDKEDKALLEAFIPEVIMPKKGKRSQAEKALEQAPGFLHLKNQHSAVESNINELEHRGLNRCPDRSRRNLDRYIGLSITAYNLHKIGKRLLSLRREEEKQQQGLAIAA